MLERALWSVVLVVTGGLGYVALDRMVSDMQQTKKLAELSRTTSSQSPAEGRIDRQPAGRQSPASGDPIGRLEIPGAGISVIVAAGTDAVTLRRGVGHIDGTALPGEPGNVGLAGHRDTVFRTLRKLRPTDPISLITADGVFEYAVESLQTVPPERMDVLDASTHPTLTLVTCYPFDFIGPAPLRFVVRAREIGRPGAALEGGGP